LLVISDQWDYQVVIERLVRSLQLRGYAIWFDVDCMKVRRRLCVFRRIRLFYLDSLSVVYLAQGSTMDAMSDVSRSLLCDVTQSLNLLM